jgi:hypothetical protein
MNAAKRVGRDGERTYENQDTLLTLS